MSSRIVTVYRDKLAIITINNPRKLNALDQDGYYQLAKAMREVAARDEVYITVLTGTGKSRDNPRILVLTHPARPVLLCVSPPCQFRPLER